MKSFIILALCAAVAVAAPVDSKDAQILVQELDNIGVEGYSFKVQTSDGKTAQEEGRLNNIGTDAEALRVNGAFSYEGPDGVLYSVTYTADENGFQPQGAHLPVN